MSSGLGDTHMNIDEEIREVECLLESCTAEEAEAYSNRLDDLYESRYEQRREAQMDERMEGRW